MAAIRSGVLIGVLAYLVGISAGFYMADGPPATRMGLAVLWPLGPIAFLVTIAALLASLLITASLTVLGRVVAPR